VFNYTRDFPFIWEEMRVPIPYSADRRKAEEILLDCVARETDPIDEVSQPMQRHIEQQYGVKTDDLTPRVFYRLTDNWLELTVRFTVHEHGVRQVKDAIARTTLDALERARIPIASATFEIVGIPQLRIVDEGSRACCNRSRATSSHQRCCDRRHCLVRPPSSSRSSPAMPSAGCSARLQPSLCSPPHECFCCCTWSPRSCEGANSVPSRVLLSADRDTRFARPRE
jgi:hypothetical protein